MASKAPDTPPLSPDGRSWWDGRAWQPLYSPDGMSRWSGHGWVRLAAPYGQPAPLVSIPAPIGRPPPPALVAPLEPVAPAWIASPQGAATPAWIASSQVAQPESYPLAPPAYRSLARPGPKPVVYLGALLAVAILATAGWMMRDQLTGAQTLPLPSPKGSELTRANHFLNDQLTPQVVEVDNSLPALQSSCTPALPPACQDAIAATDDKMRAVTTTIQRADVPPCIAVPVTAFTADWGKMQAGLEEALGGYQNRNAAFVRDGLFNASTYAKKLQPDAAAITAAAKTCPQ